MPTETSGHKLERFIVNVYIESIICISIGNIARKKHIHTRNCPITLRWIPKVLLEAQGYYDGNYHIWVPKCQLTHSPSPVQGSPVQDCPFIPTSPILVDDRGKGKLVDHDTLDLELTLLLKSYPTYPSSSERGETSEASSSSFSP